jgi:hypothetical protein
MTEREGELSGEMGRAAKARALLENPMLQEAIDTVKEHFQVQMLHSQSNETEFRDLCWRSIKAADLFYQFFTRQIESGELAEKELETIRKNKDRLIGGVRNPYGAIT